MKRIILLLFVLAFFSTSTFGENESEKAELIIKFVENLEWTQNGPNGSIPVVVGVFEAEGLTAALKEKSSTSSRTLEIKALTEADDVSGCHLVFTSAKELADLAKFLKKVSKTKAVTISNAKDFARYGVMINLVDEGTKVSYEINTMVLDGAGVKLDSKILKNATKI